MPAGSVVSANKGKERRLPCPCCNKLEDVVKTVSYGFGNRYCISCAIHFWDESEQG